ncbi:MAG TPA: bifunctional DNA-formamidopyrimidine glycosylase/DNA-(apurinic or apyrimidinic site) lyase [bacterium]|nr:bifunctional DNA-formamidopyrimidine glycosylase/DNA-(apurinic or apyrimidinic site) lyase [bacterium]HPT30175.1 bifunctional DNA-formamidopyrimidine glycosylase/DNA-(apurinic or apyrimidinic site) lyase [bacterium]
MPELPEVETIRRDLSARILGTKITKLELLSPQSVLGNKKEFSTQILGSSFREIDRIGKLLIFVLQKGKYLLIHLKMTGQLIYQTKQELIPGGHEGGEVKELPNKMTRVVFSFSDDGKLYFNDQRRFGYLKIVDAKELAKIKEKFGPEPLQAEFNASFLKKLLRGRRGNIKALLLNQLHIAGLGNIYADEALFRAGIRPMRLAGSLSEVETKKLAQEIKGVIKSAISHRGTTFSDYRDATGKRGGFGVKLQVYGRSKEKCYRCGRAITKVKLAGRGTHFCPYCQK